MGADIHMWIERKLPSGKWVLHDRLAQINREVYRIERSSPRDSAWHIATRRNYSFFAALASVRGVGPEPRGYPPDVSDYGQHELDEWSGDGHSHSWYSAAEFMPIFAEYCMGAEHAVRVVGGTTTWGRLFEEWFGTYLDRPDDLSNYRFVFFFDN